MPSFIAAALFDYVTDFAAEVSSDSSLVYRVRGDTQTVTFVENFLAQFSGNYLGHEISGFSYRSRDELIQGRRKLEREASKEGAPQTTAAQALLYELEQLCTLVRDLSYGNADDDAESFHNEYVPDLLAAAVEWLEECQDVGALEAARSALDEYREALGI
ncbi:hypothetical protein G7075_16595 [Phycicoccus sp. HDW14]|uniref:hypothetical protein n=1 Tax=Phycicoccus sp. HDW14 TaxID=2714941 RepID=UPI0014096BED|nr:hypothetical protein [Phycicoccus sp. HDW14]QIM22384.1 hypothetical protein G7075_16595 [Phycicoccus sp. HDW14]